MSAAPNIVVQPDGPALALLEEIIAIAHERAALLAALREALEQHDSAKVEEFARMLCGLECRAVREEKDTQSRDNVASGTATR